MYFDAIENHQYLLKSDQTGYNYVVVQVAETSFLEETRNQLEHAISQAKRPEEVIVEISSLKTRKQ